MTHGVGLPESEETRVEVSERVVTLTTWFKGMVEIWAMEVRGRSNTQAINACELTKKGDPIKVVYSKKTGGT